MGQGIGGYRIPPGGSAWLIDLPLDGTVQSIETETAWDTEDRRLHRGFGSQCAGQFRRAPGSRRERMPIPRQHERRGRNCRLLLLQLERSSRGGLSAPAEIVTTEFAPWATGATPPVISYLHATAAWSYTHRRRHEPTTSCAVPEDQIPFRPTRYESQRAHL